MADMPGMMQYGGKMMPSDADGDEAPMPKKKSKLKFGKKKSKLKMPAKKAAKKPAMPMRGSVLDTDYDGM